MKGGRLYAEEKRKYADFASFVLGFSKNSFFSDKIARIRLLE